MEIIFEIIFSFFGEILIQLIFELFAEAGFTAISKTRKPAESPILAGIGYFLLGLIAGGVSLLIYKNQFIADPGLQIMNLIFTPIFIGLIMMQIRKGKVKYGKVVTRLDSFTYGAVFAFAMGLVRYIWAA